MVTVPADSGQSAQVTSLAAAAQSALGTFAGDLVALILAAFSLLITVVYNYSFARLVFVSGLDRALPAARATVDGVRGVIGTLRGCRTPGRWTVSGRVAVGGAAINGGAGFYLVGGLAVV